MSFFQVFKDRAAQAASAARDLATTVGTDVYDHVKVRLVVTNTATSSLRAAHHSLPSAFVCTSGVHVQRDVRFKWAQAIADTVSEDASAAVRDTRQKRSSDAQVQYDLIS
jgi:hypothetical protein